ncbi:MAG: PilZ domain-containing protein [Elusimicrobia bacterium]|nr:PilZ domain-containing protein [Elusimicrobiota bacterium]
MATLSGGERRRHERRDRDDLTLRLSFSGRSLPDVQLRNVSSGGFGVQVNAEIKAGQALKFELDMPGDSVKGGAKVVWAEAFHMGYRGGIEITDLGWLARRRLSRAIDGQPPIVERLIDGLLLIAAAVLFGLVAVDLMRHPENFLGLLKRLGG